MKKLFWLSWWQPGDDYRPLTFPPNVGVLGWWCTAESDIGNALCALVVAETEEAAKNIVNIDWPEANNWRFCDEWQSIELSDRFPLSDWVVERIAAYNAT